MPSQEERFTSSKRYLYLAKRMKKNRKVKTYER